MRWMTVTRAKAVYGLTEADLEDLHCVYSRNPHHKMWAPMRRYYVPHLEKAAKRKRNIRKRSPASNISDRLRAVEADIRGLRDRISSVESQHAPSGVSR